MNALKVNRKHCSCCGIDTKFECNTMVWGLGDLVMFFPTFGGWLLLRAVFDQVCNPWRCATCGTEAPMDVARTVVFAAVAFFYLLVLFPGRFL